mmetsp:Transcript_3960/g.9449  ORF Transcript_3960/g.9449 Transcript_3960/m.9449 type:complete len:89 (-) Transcript_3960:938-1204(-)
MAKGTINASLPETKKWRTSLCRGRFYIALNALSVLDGIIADETLCNVAFAVHFESSHWFERRLSPDATEKSPIHFIGIAQQKCQNQFS